MKFSFPESERVFSLEFVVLWIAWFSLLGHFWCECIVAGNWKLKCLIQFLDLEIIFMSPVFLQFLYCKSWWIMKIWCSSCIFVSWHGNRILSVWVLMVLKIESFLLQLLRLHINCCESWNAVMKVTVFEQMSYRWVISTKALIYGILKMWVFSS